MKILKQLLGYIGYIAKFLIYILSSFIINPKLFIVLTIGVSYGYVIKYLRQLTK